MSLRRLLGAGLVCLMLACPFSPLPMTGREAGRLYIDSIGVDVALYRSNKQSVVDREDSAAWFDLDAWPGHMLIADHVTQSFARLNEVEIGDCARIVTAEDDVLHYICTEVFDGHNNGLFITDDRGFSVVGDAELLMYTCLSYWRNVRVTLWDPLPATMTDIWEGGVSDGL